jgi:hypothetical protein
MTSGLPSIAFCIGIDPTLPRDSTDFMTPRVAMRIVSLQNRFELRATLNIGGKGVAREILYRKQRQFF